MGQPDVEYLGEEEIKSLLAREDFTVDVAMASIERWVHRGDTALLYRNEEIGHREAGNIQIVSYGGPAAQIEQETHPTFPETLPDIGGAINWRYRLFAAYRGQSTEDEETTAFLAQAVQEEDE